jgi:hypothetical protein
MSLVIGLLSCNKPFAAERRDLCRGTWIQEAYRQKYEVVFLIGGHDKVELQHDELWLPVKDDYRSLPQKTKAFCRWAVDCRYDWLFKADDDTLIIPERFNAFMDQLPSGVEYAGNKWCQDAKPYASGGAGYLLSARAAALVAEQSNQPRGYEDVITGNIMKANRVGFHVDPRLIAFGNETKVPLPENDIITTHKIPKELWIKSWESLCVSGSTG